MKSYKCLMFLNLSVDREVTGAFKDIEALSLKDAAVSYCKDYLAAQGTYYLAVTDGKGHSCVYEIIMKYNIQNKPTVTIKEMKTLNKDTFDVLISHTLSK